QYPVVFLPDVSGLLQHSRDFLRMLAQGMAVVPFAVGTAWAVRHLVKPADPRVHAGALVLILAPAALLYSLSQGVLDERYVAYLVWLPLLGTVAALVRRDAPVLGVAVAGILAALLVTSHTPSQDLGGYSTFAHPGEQWWAR